MFHTMHTTYLSLTLFLSPVCASVYPWTALEAHELHADCPGADVLPDNTGGGPAQVTRRHHNMKVTEVTLFYRLYAKSWIDSFLPKDFSTSQSNGEDSEKTNGESQKMLHEAP